MGITCDRLENLTECFSEIKMKNDAGVLYDRSNFFRIVDTEIRRSRHYGGGLSFCLLKIGFDQAKSDLDNTAKDRIIRAVGNIFNAEGRDWDILHQYDGQSFSLLMPQTSIDEAQHLCNNMKRISEESLLKTDGFSPTIEFGWAEFSPENDGTGLDLLARASAEIQNVI